MRATGFTLSGGGAKGSFEVGACKYLMQTSGIRPDVITCTSVGAVNGMKLAEGEGQPFQFQGQTFHRGLDGLEQIWLAMASPSDVYSPSAALKALPIDYYTALPLEISQLANQLLGNVLSQVGAAAPYLILLGALGIPFVNLGPPESEIDQVMALLESTNFYTLDPIASIYDVSIDRALIAGSGIELLLATVGLSGGELCYVRLVGEDGHGNLVGDLVDRDSVGDALPAPGAIGYPIDMKAGMLASAADPIMFEPQHLLPDYQTTWSPSRTEACGRWSRSRRRSTGGASGSLRSTATRPTPQPAARHPISSLRRMGCTGSQSTSLPSYWTRSIGRTSHHPPRTSRTCGTSSRCSRWKVISRSTPARSG
ncbi:MAG: patatin-like phospholipase family protein [Candidatus Dormibacteria bacterium]